jgi:pyridoxine 5-phosphate synthase
MARLGVNIDHVATLRQVRNAKVPDMVAAAMLCEKSGADSIVVHLREDRRHIQDKDVFDLRKAVRTRLNLEMSVAEEIVDIACKIRPDQATIVPEKRKELTTEGGLDVVFNFKRLQVVRKLLENKGIAVSLFVDPQKKQIDSALRLGIRRLEFHTGRFADADSASKKKKSFKEIIDAVSYARQKGFHVYAGHGLDYQNIKEVARIKGIEEFNIGYSIVCRAVLIGLAGAVKEMKAMIK